MKRNNVFYWYRRLAKRPLLVWLSLFQCALIAVGLSAALSPTDLASAAPQELEWLSVEDNNLVDESGDTVVLRGANLIRYNWKWPGAKAMKMDFDIARRFTAPIEQGGWGANSFTLWVDSNPVLDNDTQYMRWMDGMVDVAKENGAYLILSWHADDPQDSHPERITKDGFRAMAEVANRYRDVPNVIYAAQAEPGFSTNSVERWRELRDQQEELIDRIRSENPRALVGVSGTSWSQHVHWMLDNPVRRDHIFVKPHLYGPLSEMTSERQIPEIAERWPVVIGEFGTGGRMDNGDTREMIRYAEEHLSGWQAWNLSDEGPPVMLASSEAVTPTTYGQLVRAELERRGKRTNR